MRHHTDLPRGFTQLAVVLVALHWWLGVQSNQVLTEAMRTGNIWQFSDIGTVVKLEKSSPSIWASQNPNMIRIGLALSDMGCHFNFHPAF